MLIIDKYAYTNALKDYNPMAKFYFAIGFLILSIINKNIGIYLFIIGFMSFMIVYVAKINLKYYLKMLCIPLSFLMLSIIAIIFSVSSTDESFIFSFKIFHMNIGISEISLHNAKLLFFRAISSIVCTYFMALTIPFNQIIIVLKNIKLPHVLIEMIILMYRFIFIFLEESKEIYDAQHIRFGYNTFKNGYKSLSILVSILFTRVMIRYFDMSVSLEVKLYDGKFHV